MGNTTKKTRNLSPVYIVGIGGSAGALEPLKAFVSKLPDNDPSFCVVVAQHIDPVHESRLNSLLGPPANWKVQKAENGKKLKAGTIYYVAGGFEIKIQEGKVMLEPHQRKQKAVPSIDAFFASLAEDQREKSIGVIISGSGKDGAKGLASIRACGGYTLAQQPNEAEHSNMPEAAISTGEVHTVASANKMPRHIMNYIKTHTIRKSKPENNATFSDILKLLASHMGTDFGSYKKNTIKRRIDKRVSELRLNDIEEYYLHIKENPAELDRLFANMLIGVTEFLRDRSAFETLEEHLRKMVSTKKKGDTIRLWSVGCATGEEAYSLLLLLLNILGKDVTKYDLQLFATDINEEALSFARKGRYPGERLENLPKDWLTNYFEKTEDGVFELKKAYRQYVLFSRHDITTDPPFVRLDLIACRNLLIYFSSGLQREVLPVFHYGLNGEGLLFLGKSENTSLLDNLFKQEDAESKIYRKNPEAEFNRMRYSRFRNFFPKKSTAPPLPAPELSLEEIAAHTLAKKFEHPYVVVGEDLEVLLIKGRLQPYLDLRDGSLNPHLYKIINSHIHPELRTCFTKVRRNKESCRSNLIRFKLGEVEHHLVLVIKPLLYLKNGNQNYLVIFEKTEPDPHRLVPPEIAEGDHEANLLKIMELEQELSVTREHLQTFNEELESANEELQSVNEELQSANEEMEVANEELETTNQELEATNEELNMTNQEMNSINLALKEKEDALLKIQGELELTRDRFEMALANSRVYISYQDKNLKYYWSNNRSEKFSNIDILGKTDLDLLGHAGNEIVNIKKKVLATGKDFTGEVNFANGYWETSVKPVMEKGKIAGVKTVAVDITESRRAIEETHKQQSIIRSIIEESKDFIVVLDLDYNILALNKSAREFYKKRFGEPITEGDDLMARLDHFPKERKEFGELLAKVTEGEKITLDRVRSDYKNSSGKNHFFNLQLFPIHNDGKLFGMAVITSDITARIVAEEQINHVIRHTANLSEDEFFSDLTDQMYSLYKAQHIYFAFYDKEINTIETKAYRQEGKLAANFSYKLEGTPCQKVIAENKLKHISDVAQKFKGDPKLKKWGSENYCGIPVTSPTSGEVLGIFVMASNGQMPVIPNSNHLFNVITLRAGLEIESVRNLQHLKTRDHQLYKLTQNLPEMIYEYISTDEAENDHFTYVSGAVENIYEITAEEMYRNPQLAWDSIYEEDFESFVNQMEESSKKLTTFSWTGRLVARESFRLRWVKITSKPEKIKEDCIKWYGIIDDISRIMHIEQELVYAKKQAEDSAAAKEEFLATMSHEIRTPLNGIVGITDIMISEATPGQMEYLNLLKFSAENLMTLINNILDFSKLNAGKIDVSEANIHLKILLKNLKHSHSYRARENGNELSFQVDERIPDMVRGDDMILLQILNNLIGNAVKFTRNGKISLILDFVSEDAENTTIRFEVQDTGVGIAKNDIEKIFEKFQQVGDRSQNTGGTGLGLAISKKLLDILGTELKVKSKLGKGTSFYFTLSLKKAFFDKKGKVHAQNEIAFPELQHPLNILLVEDVKENKELLLRYFKKTENLVADSASNGKEAVEKLLEKDFDIVLMDIRMPVMDGREAASIIRSWENEKYKSLPIIALTADTFLLEDEPDFTDIITKPFSPRELRTKLMEYANNVDGKKG